MISCAGHKRMVWCHNTPINIKICINGTVQVVLQLSLGQHDYCHGSICTWSISRKNICDIQMYVATYWLLTVIRKDYRNQWNEKYHSQWISETTMIYNSFSFMYLKLPKYCIPHTMWQTINTNIVNYIAKKKEKKVADQWVYRTSWTSMRGNLFTSHVLVWLWTHTW